MGADQPVEIALGSGERNEAVCQDHLVERRDAVAATDVIDHEDRYALVDKVALEDCDRLLVGLQRIVLVLVATIIEILDRDAADDIEIGFSARAVVPQVVENPGAVLGNDEKVRVGFTGMLRQGNHEIDHALCGLFLIDGIAGLSSPLGNFRAPEIIGVYDVEIGRIESGLDDGVEVAGLLVVEHGVLPVRIPVPHLAPFRPVGIDRPEPVRRRVGQLAGGFTRGGPVLVPVVAEIGGLSDGDIGDDHGPPAHAVLHSGHFVDGKPSAIGAIARRIDDQQVMGGGNQQIDILRGTIQPLQLVTPVIDRNGAGGRLEHERK
jgi:hypothetical protein